MLTALVLLGLLPLAVLPFLGREPNSKKENAAPSALPAATGSVFGARGGTHYAIVASDGEQAIASFKPGEDAVDIDLTGMPGEIFYSTHTDEGGVALAFNSDAGESMTLRFAGLSHSPKDDIRLTMPDPDASEAAMVMLSDVVEVMSHNNAEPAEDLAAARTQSGRPEQTIPNARETAPSPTHAESGSQTSQESTLPKPRPPAPNTPPSPENTAEGLPAEAGDWATDPEADLRPMASVEIVEGFVAGEDVLRIFVEGDPGEPKVDVSASPDGLDAWVTLDGALVAILRGAASATIWDIYLETKPKDAVA